MIRLTDTVKHLIIINVLAFFAYESLIQVGFDIPLLGVLHPTHPLFKPYQLVTHIFMHGGPQHLFFNMLMLFFMGPSVEDYIGNKKFLLLYLAAGFLSTFLGWGINATGILGSGYLNTYSVGASGAIFGVIAAYGFLFPEREVMLLIPPIPIKGKYLAILFIGFGILTDHAGTTGHLAHLCGAIIGAGLIWYWKNKRML